MTGKLYVRACKVQYACELMGLLMHKFTFAHPSVVAVTTMTQVHVPLSSTEVVLIK